MLKRSVCIMKKTASCSPCALASSCPYAIIFETPNVATTEKMRSATHFPHPFSFTPLFAYPSIFLKDDTFHLKLSLFGTAIKFFPHIIHALMQLGKRGIGYKRGKYTISQIIDYASGKTIFNGEKILSQDIQSFVFSDEFKGNRLTLSFFTPCKIKLHGEYLRQFNMKIIIENIKRRIENISYFFGENPVEINVNHINYNDIACVKSDLRWAINKRFSKRKHQHMYLGGFLGEVQIEGALNAVYPLLEVGEVINIGSNTSFGFGAIHIIPC